MITRETLASGVVFTVYPPAEFLRHTPTARESYTYRIGRVDIGGAEVELKSGDGFIRVARIDPEYGHVNLVRSAPIAPSSWPCRILARVVANVWTGTGDAIAANGWRVESTAAGELAAVPAGWDSV
jgi:hypothetical protein